MSPHKILIASVLKPADDVRMAWKLGKSIAKLEGTEVHVAGFRPRQQQIEGLTMHPLFNFGRLSLRRAMANIKVLRLALRIQPSIFVLTTHELLPAAFIIKKLCHSKIIYDVQENYYRNIRFSDAFPAIIRKPLAAVIRTIENTSATFIDYFLLAEKAYYNELPFVRGKAVILENKYMKHQPVEVTNALPVSLTNLPKIRLLYSGTIALTYGILEAIKLTDALHQIDQRYELTVIGFAAQKEVLQQVQQAIAGKSYINIIGGERLVPHSKIIQAISESHFGLIPNHPNASQKDYTPTKIYEYLAHHLPILLPNNETWRELIIKWKAGEFIDFTFFKAKEIHEMICSESFYTIGRPTGIYWNEEEKKLLEVINNQLFTLQKTLIRQT